MSITFLRLPEVKKRTGLSRSSIYAGMSDGTFPSNVPLGPQGRGWIDKEIDEWQSQRIAEREERRSKIKLVTS
jgi:prophage regulatory protein